MKIELFYDNKGFIFRKGAITVARAPFDTLVHTLETANVSAVDMEEIEFLLSDYMPGEILRMPGVKGVVLGPARAFTHAVGLRAVGNPDQGQFADTAPQKTVRVVGVGEAIAAVVDYQKNYEMGLGNCHPEHGRVWALPTTPSGRQKFVGSVSYNGVFAESLKRRKPGAVRTKSRKAKDYEKV